MAKVMPKVLKICRILLGTGRVCLGDMLILAKAILWHIMAPYWNYKTIWVCLKTEFCPENPVLYHHFWFWFAIYNHITTNIKFKKYHSSVRKWSDPILSQGFEGVFIRGKNLIGNPSPLLSGSRHQLTLETLFERCRIQPGGQLLRFLLELLHLGHGLLFPFPGVAGLSVLSCNSWHHLVANASR